MQLIALTGLTLAAALGFSSLIISAAALALGSRSTGRIAPLGTLVADRPDVALTGSTLAATFGFSSLIISAAALALGSAAQAASRS